MLTTTERVFRIVPPRYNVGVVTIVAFPALIACKKQRGAAPGIVRTCFALKSAPYLGVTDFGKLPFSAGHFPGHCPIYPNRRIACLSVRETVVTGSHLPSYAARRRVAAGSLRPEIFISATSIHFKETPAHSSYDWHNDPVPQYVLTLSGVLEFTMKGGETFTLHPGEVLVAEDHTGTGHKWRLVNDDPWRRAYVIFAPGADTQFVPD